ncbi:hypothetical protein QYF61_009954 [Mycteria americana]|uniref:Uncharacterized protein n=1 Tax=Mycteria americana TaxID=33587 RepID=A0AAN7NRQ9_MYCAM|nr:hypothetical protein QYF61_009954 [Mycteria americana]
MVYLQQRLQSHVSVLGPLRAGQMEAGSCQKLYGNGKSAVGPRLKVLKGIKCITLGSVACLQEFKGSWPELVCARLAGVRVHRTTKEDERNSTSPMNEMADLATTDMEKAEYSTTFLPWSSPASALATLPNPQNPTAATGRIKYCPP